ncbi:MAG: hypothetical protein IIV90_05235 [Oscillospiraceae bacterium]|nr:hypothetical protein [Oscillospiraceae bacterium]
MVQTMKLAVTYALCIMGTGTVVFQLVPELLLGMFKASPEMLAIGVPALRIISTLFPFAAFGIIATSSFQALGKGVWAMLTSLARQLGLLLPAAFLLSLTGRLELVWLAFPIAEGGSVVLCIIFLRRIWATIITPLRRSVATGQPAGILKDTL